MRSVNVAMKDSYIFADGNYSLTVASDKHHDVSNACGHFYYYGLTLIPAWISNYIHYKLWDKLTYQFLNFNGCTV